MNKRSQIKMTETLAILVVFFILLLFGLMFYSNIQKSSLDKQREEWLAKKAISISSKTSYLSELRCSKGFDIVFPDCIDLQKAEIMQNKFTTNSDYYKNILSTSHIYIKDLISEQEIELFNNALPQYTKITSIPTPVLIYDAAAYGTCSDIRGKCDFGVLYVDIYS